MVPPYSDKVSRASPYSSSLCVPFRVVRNKEGQVFVDATGKMNGRGAYLKRSLEAIEIAKKKKVLSRSLQVEIPDEIFEELKKYCDE